MAGSAGERTGLFQRLCPSEDSVRPNSVRSLSAVICAYNEAGRIGDVLQAAVRNPHIGEIIVVDDGSSDATAAEALSFAGVTLLANGENRGKSWSLARGVAACTFDHVMLLDADLVGLSVDHLTSLAAPVLDGVADVTISLRRDSLYRALGIDFVSGERVLPRAVLMQVLAELHSASRWSAEVLINQLIIERNLRLAIVDWDAVTHASKLRKQGLAGAFADLRMAHDILAELSAVGLVRQTLALRHAARLT